MYKMLTYSIKTRRKIGVEAIKNNALKNLVGNKTQYYSDKLKKKKK